MLSRRSTLTVMAMSVAAGALAQTAVSPIKKALCIGNANYPSRPLRNPVNDARAVGNALRELGFEVNLLTNANLAQMRAAFRNILDSGSGLHSVFIYYAGHGFEVAGVNYLMPVDTNLDLITSTDVSQSAVSLKGLAGDLERTSARIKVVVVDACRDAPKRGGNGNATMQQMAAKGTLLAFSTSPGALAEDSIGGPRATNSPYAFALTESLRNRELSLKEMFNRTNSTVALLTQDRQIPWVHDGLTGDIRLLDNKEIVTSAVVASSQITTGGRNQSSRGADGLDELSESQRIDLMSQEEARKYLSQTRGHFNADMARWSVHEAKINDVKLYLKSKLPFNLIDSYGKNPLIKPVIEHHPNIPAVITLLAENGFDVLKPGYGFQDEMKLSPDSPKRLIQLLRSFDRKYAGESINRLVQQVLPAAIWYQNLDAVNALLKSGASLDSPVLMLNEALQPMNGTFKISTCREEAIAMGLRF